MEPLRLNWSQGEHDFLLRIGELEALDDATREGVLDFRYRLSLGSDRGSLGYSPVRIREIIDCLRLGLIGGGMDRNKALEKAKRAFLEDEVSVLNLMAFEIITHSLKGKEHDMPGEETAEAVDTQESNSDKSTETAQS